MTDQGLTVSAAASGRRLDVAGELDAATKDELRAALDGCLDGGGDLTVDLSAVTFIDSSGLTVLVQAHNELSSSGGRLIVANPSTVVVRLLQLTRLSALLNGDGAEE